jgi:para-nitrobenzyl esterase
MFWIFGGAFVLGDEQEFGWYNGNNLAHNEDVIIVAANYRVGAFGFLAHEDLAAEQPSGTTGNYGIQDQRMALRWVQDNIASFGGNPDDVTIFGQSAGGMSVCTLVANPINQGLFTRAVMQSGTCNSPEFYQELPNALDFGKTYGEVVGCDSDSDTFLSCMRGKKTGEIMYGIFKAWEDFKRKDPEKFAIMSNFTEIDHLNSLAMSWLPTLAPLMPFGPVVDGTEEGMPKLPYDAMRDGEHNRIAFMAGTTSNEGSLFLPMIPSIVKGVNHLPLTEDGVRLTVDHCLGPVIGNDVIDEMYPDLMALYDINDYKNYDDQLSHILRDYMFTCSTRRAVRQVSKWATEDTPVFLYQFNYMSRWLDFKVMGDYHTSEIYFLFDNAWPPVIHRFNKDDEGMAAIMGGYWTQFARSGNPNGENTAGEWPKFDVAGDNYLELNLPPIQKSALAKDACDFHDKMLGYADDL